jgi:trehalose synthase
MMLGIMTSWFRNPLEKSLVSDVESCASKVLDLLENVVAARAFGAAGRENVRKRFLLPRLMRDELKLVKEVIER